METYMVMRRLFILIALGLAIAAVPAASFASALSSQYSGLIQEDRAAKHPTPSDENILIKNHTGSITKENPRGGFVVDKVNGNVELRANGSISVGLVEGNLNAVTAAGDIEIDDVQGAVTAVAQVGNITIRKVLRHVFAQVEMGEIIIHSAPTAEVHNIFGGDVKLLDLSGNANISVRGNILIVINKEFLKPKSFDLTSKEGDTTIYIPEDFNADLEIKVPLALKAEEIPLIKSEFSLSVIKQEFIDQNQYINIKTKINNGGKLIKISSNSRNLFLKKRKK